MTAARGPRLVHAALLDAAGAHPAKEMVADEEVRLTYGELVDRARRLACVLRDDGLEPGDRVVLYLDNSVDTVAGIYGIWMAGGVISAVKPQTRPEKLVFILNDCEASFLLAEARSAAVAAAAVALAPSVRRVYATRMEVPVEGVTELEEALASASGEPRDAGRDPLDLASLVYTSGTTGRPKGVMMSHAALDFTTGSIAEYLELDASDRILSFLPLAFSYGLSQLLLTARLGATLLLERSFAYPARTLHRIRDEEPTVLPAVPTALSQIVGMEHEAPYPSLRCLTNAAAGLPPALHAGLREVFPNARLYRMYGQTECVRVCYLAPEMIERKPTSVGRAIPGTEAFVLDEEGREVKPGEVGVLHTRGPHVMLGYWRAPEATARTLSDGPHPGERTLRTHDYFTVDEDGDLYFVDRSDDMIKTGGEKVSSVEVENALHEIAGIAQAAVIGVPDERLGQVVRAYVVLREGSSLTEREIIRGCRTRLEGFMVPREVVFVVELPHTDSGKVRKKSLAAVAEADTA